MAKRNSSTDNQDRTSMKGDEMTDWVDAIRDYRNAATDVQIADGQVWYSGMAAIMNAHADASGLTPEQCAGIYAANSINTPWSRNLALAAQCIADYTAGIDVRIRTLGMIVRKCEAIIAGKDIDTALTPDPANLKIRNFRRNLNGEADAVTVDRWAFRIATRFADCEFRGDRSCARKRLPEDGKTGRATGPLTGNGHSCGRVPTGAEYNAMADAYRVIAAEFGETPAQTQAVTWCVVRGDGE